MACGSRITAAVAAPSSSTEAPPRTATQASSQAKPVNGARTNRARNAPTPMATIITPIIAKITDSTAPSMRPAVLASRYS